MAIGSVARGSDPIGDRELEMMKALKRVGIYESKCWTNSNISDHLLSCTKEAIESKNWARLQEGVKASILWSQHQFECHRKALYNEGNGISAKDLTFYDGVLSRSPAAGISKPSSCLSALVKQKMFEEAKKVVECVSLYDTLLGQEKMAPEYDLLKVVVLATSKYYQQPPEFQKEFVKEVSFPISTWDAGFLSHLISLDKFDLAKQCLDMIERTNHQSNLNVEQGLRFCLGEGEDPDLLAAIEQLPKDEEIQKWYATYSS